MEMVYSQKILLERKGKSPIHKWKMSANHKKKFLGGVFGYGMEGGFENWDPMDHPPPPAMPPMNSIKVYSKMCD